MTRLVYLLFFCSGVSGLIYQVVWVRVFGNVFGNTIYSASVVVAVFMVGLGIGGWVVGAWADRQYRAAGITAAHVWPFRVADRPGRAWHFRAPATLERNLCARLVILARRERLVRPVDRFLSRSYRIAVVLLMPITLLMGGTLTLLIRHLVRRDPHADAWRIAVLYGINTAGAALGCLLTDFALVPVAGLQNTQIVAAALNVVAGLGALLIARSPARVRSVKRRRAVFERPAGAADPPSTSPPSTEVTLTVVALAMIGFAAMGMEIVWFRHLTILLGGFRAVFSLLLTVILVGIGAGSLLCVVIDRHTVRPAHWLMSVQGLFVAFTLLGLAIVDVSGVEAMRAAPPKPHRTDSRECSQRYGSTRARCCSKSPCRRF